MIKESLPNVQESINVIPFLSKYINTEGFPFTISLEKSKGTYLYDITNNRYILDFFGFFGTLALGHNHPAFEDPDFIQDLLIASISNPSNSDFYTIQYKKFMEKFATMAMGEDFQHAFFISGGALAVENALKVAMDWKVQKNFKKGYPYEKGYKVIHFREAFHGRSGYTLSLTNTDPIKIKHFAKFDWPRITNPKLKFPITEKNLEETIKLEKQAIEEIKKAFYENKDDICAIIIEPIQCEGGDNHFRKDFLKALRELANENEALLIFDEVQVGGGSTGKFWCYQHFNVKPDILAFGKKLQVCGIIANNRIDEVPDNCFKVRGRINSTWGGSLADMVRSTKIMETIQKENLLENASKMGNLLLQNLINLSQKYPLITNPRGLGLICAIDLPSKEIRDKLKNKALDNSLLLLIAGEKTIRFRPPLTVSENEILECIEKLEKAIKEI